jgi:WD40 repeat protein
MSGHLLKAYAECTAAEAVEAVTWSPDGSRIASTEGYRTVQLWDAGSEQCLFTYTGHADSVYAAVAWSPDGSRIASGSTDGTVQVWQAV